MLYLIGGISRAGKSLVAQRLLETHRVPRFSVDYFTTALQRGNPSLGINHAEDRIVRSIKLWPYLKPLLSNLLHEEPLYTIEGEALSPHLVKEFVDENPGRTRACFLGYPRIEVETKLADTFSFTGRINNWVVGMTPQELRNCIVNGIADSANIERERRSFSLEFFDTSQDFEAIVDSAANFLISGCKNER